MSKTVAFIFPGQGAQYPGMGRDFYEQFEEAKAVFEEADRILEKPFSKLIFEGDKQELTLTKNSQLAIFITSVAILRAFEAQNPGVTPAICAGLSLGEYTALVAANKLSFKDALLIVKARGEFMHKACEENPGVMHVVLGLELSVVEEAIKETDGVWIANLNCPRQIVIGGTKESCEKISEVLKEKGARRVMPLDVSGAFHSGLMQSAQEALKPMIEALEIQESEIDVVMNVSGDFVSQKEVMQEYMTKQVTHSVLWQKSVEAMVNAGVTQFIEMGPGKTLAGMNKRIGVTAPTMSIEKVEDLQGVIHGF